VDRIYQFLIPIIIAWLVVRLYDAIDEEYLQKLAEQTETDLDDVLLPLLRSGIKFIAIGLGIVMGLSNAGYDVMTILAGLGLGGFAFALAAKDTVSNIFGGITIFLQQPFKVGDKIEVKGIQGRVSEIGLRSTTLLEPKSKWKIIIPNETFISHLVQNLDSRRHNTVAERLHLALDTKPHQVANALRLIKEIINNNPHTIKAWVALDKLTRYSFELNLLYYIERWQPEEKELFSNEREKRYSVKSEIYINILEQLEQHDIQLAVHLPHIPQPLINHQVTVENGSPPLSSLLKQEFSVSSDKRLPPDPPESEANETRTDSVRAASQSFTEEASQSFAKKEGSPAISVKKWLSGLFREK
jgi:MscS family membrane protein